MYTYLKIDVHMPLIKSKMRPEKNSIPQGVAFLAFISY